MKRLAYSLELASVRFPLLSERYFSATDIFGDGINMYVCRYLLVFDKSNRPWRTKKGQYKPFAISVKTILKTCGLLSLKQQDPGYTNSTKHAPYPYRRRSDNRTGKWLEGYLFRLCMPTAVMVETLSTCPVQIELAT